MFQFLYMSFDISVAYLQLNLNNLVNYEFTFGKMQLFNKVVFISAYFSTKMTSLEISVTKNIQIKSIPNLILTKFNCGNCLHVTFLNLNLICTHSHLFPN